VRAGFAEIPRKIAGTPLRAWSGMVLEREDAQARADAECP
jgi:hypothetical protein